VGIPSLYIWSVRIWLNNEKSSYKDTIYTNSPSRLQYHTLIATKWSTQEPWKGVQIIHYMARESGLGDPISAGLWNKV